MKIKRFFLIIAAAFVALGASAQVENAGGVKKRTEKDKKAETSVGVTQRMQSTMSRQKAHDADLSYMRGIYRNLDLSKPQNAALYYPEDVVDGRENLFRIILNLVVDGKVPAYEYLDGREVFTDQYKVNVADMLERFGIYAQEAKGSTEKNPKFTIEEADVPTTQVLNYYIIEKWEFDRRTNRMHTVVEAICPVLNRAGDFGGEARYPMFWVKYDALRPWLTQQYVFVSDDNNLPQYSIDDYFTLGLYDGEIYKTQNLRNLSMAQMWPDEDDRQRAADSIDNRLRTYGKDLFVPSREEYLAQKEREANGQTAESADIPERKTTVSDSDSEAPVKATSSRAKKKAKKAKAKVSSGSSSQASSRATKSVRRRKR